MNRWGVGLQGLEHTLAAQAHSNKLAPFLGGLVGMFPYRNSPFIGVIRGGTGIVINVRMRGNIPRGWLLYKINPKP